MTKLVALFVVLALAQAANALECYSCNPDTCLKQGSWVKVPNCGKSTIDTTHAGACLKEIYKDENKEVTSRKCVIASKGPDGKLTHNCDKGAKSILCEICTTDLCNSAPNVRFSYIAALGVMVAYLIPRLI